MKQRYNRSCQVPRPRTHDQHLRVRLIDEAGRLLSAEGPAALTTRRLAERADTSASAVYSLFGDKAGLVREMFGEGFHRLARRFAELTPSDDPMEDLRALGRAFRANALANPHLYDLMFSCPFPDFRPGEEDLPDAFGTFQLLVDVVQRCLDRGVFAPGDALDISLVLFGVVDGLAGLEIRGWLGSPEEAGRRWELAFQAVAEGLRPPAATGGALLTASPARTPPGPGAPSRRRPGGSPAP
jgi:AcrR family transcriptional regulator